MQHVNLEMPTTPASDPTNAGTPEERWREVLAAGGLIHSWAVGGRAVTIVSVTDGEAAFPRWRGLDLVRRDELKGALRKLCPTHVSVVHRTARRQSRSI